MARYTCLIRGPYVVRETTTSPFSTTERREIQFSAINCNILRANLPPLLSHRGRHRLKSVNLPFSCSSFDSSCHAIVIQSELTQARVLTRLAVSRARRL